MSERGKSGRRSVTPVVAGADVRQAIRPDAGDLARLLANEHDNPHSILGAHAAQVGETHGVIIRVMHPDATSADAIVQPGGERIALEPVAPGVFAAFLAAGTLPLHYRVAFHFGDGAWERGDPYRFLPTIGEVDLHLFNEGTHRRLWQKMGAHHRVIDGVEGVSFAVWAPSAKRVSVVGEFCGWDGRLLPMRMLGSSGVWELFVPDVQPGSLYKFEILTRDRRIRVKTDPFAAAMELPPETASKVVASGTYSWLDGQWMTERSTRDPVREPMLIYEVHLGSWARIPEEGDRWLTYREIAPRLIDHVKTLGFTHLELLPVAEHPFTGSWG